MPAITISPRWLTVSSVAAPYRRLPAYAKPAFALSNRLTRPESGAIATSTSAVYCTPISIKPDLRRRLDRGCRPGLSSESETTCNSAGIVSVEGVASQQSVRGTRQLAVTPLALECSHAALDSCARIAIILGKRCPAARTCPAYTLIYPSSLPAAAAPSARSRDLYLVTGMAGELISFRQAA